MRRPLLQFFAVFGAVLAVSLATFLPTCNLLFSCGCTFAGASHCNIHHVSGPECPWCSHGNGPFAIGYAAAMLGASGSIAGSLRFRAARGQLVIAFAGGFVGYAASLSLAALATALYYHYPSWYGLRL